MSARTNKRGRHQPLKPIAHEVLVSARQYRLARIREQLLAFDCAAILLYDPVDIRYALDVADGGCELRRIHCGAGLRRCRAVYVLRHADHPPGTCRPGYPKWLDTRV